MENNDFYKSFMSGVKNGVPSISSQKEARADKNKAIIWVLVGLALLLLVVIGIVALVANNSSTTTTDSEEDSMDAEVSDEVEESTSDGGAVYYSEAGYAISIRMTCKNSNLQYDFYRDNSYEISPGNTTSIIEEGTYVIKGDSMMTLTIKYGRDRDVMLNGRQLMDSSLTLECEEIGDY